jgi:hypothetical protein
MIEKRWFNFVCWLALFAFVAWGLDLSKGDWLLGLMILYFAKYEEFHFQFVSKQLEGLEDKIQGT